MLSKMKKIKILKNKTCHYCKLMSKEATKLRRKGYEVEECFCEDNPEDCKGINAVPTIMIGSRKLVGFHSAEDIEKEL